jgi:hypothetical protein
VGGQQDDTVALRARQFADRHNDPNSPGFCP